MPEVTSSKRVGERKRKRNILFITTDQQRYDSLGCNGGTVARTPVVDRLAAEGINYRRAYNQNTVCMPARSTMLTGQYVRTHGVVANGIPLPVDAPSIAQYLHDKAGYRTALLGKAHFEPNFDPQRQFEENARVARGDIGPWRGFERSEQALHAAAYRGHPIAHYGRWLKANHPEHLESFAGLLQGTPGGDTGAPETKNNPIPREWYHTDWVADLTVDWLRSLGTGEPWFCWMSFPDPHHPWDPPASELPRVPWQDLDLPPGHPGSDEEIRRVLARKPAHWLAYWDGAFSNMEGGPASFVPSKLSDDQIREVNAKVHVMNELIDEACGRVLQTVGERGWLDDTDVVFTTDHGELQGDFGLLYKGPYHTDALDAVALRVAARTQRRGDSRRRERSGWSGRPGTHVLRHRRHRPGSFHAGLRAPDGRRRARTRAGAVRVGQPIPGLRHAPAFRLPRRVALYGLRTVDGRAAQRTGGDMGRRGAHAVSHRVRADGNRARWNRYRDRRALQRRR